MDIKILDCTLRDGGYINNWEFGENAIKIMIQKLSQSKIDIIECGFLTNKTFKNDFTLFDRIEVLAKYIHPKNEDLMYVAMIQFGKDEIKLEKISDYKKGFIDGIRIIFQEQDINKAVKYAQKIMKKGYKVFMQPVKLNFYNDEKLLKLIQKMNKLNPHAFYIVDTFGSMYKKDLLKFFHLIDNNLKENIKIGFHSHNNLQLSFSLAQTLINIKTKREIIIDSSVFGMGRGAGNLSTELLARYINDNIQNKYEITPLLNIYDEHLSSIFAKTPWGYSLPHFLSAIHNCHPNYSTYLLNKQTISVETINIILNQIPQEHKSNFDIELIENLYIKIQQNRVDDKNTKKILKNKFKNKKILILAPGQTILNEKDKIQKFINKEKPIVISVNFLHKSGDYMFVSNTKRFKKIINNLQLDKPIIITSNIAQEEKENVYVLNYESLLLDDHRVSDNAGLILIKFLINIGAKEVFLAGFDGFDPNKEKNYFDQKLINNVEIDELIKRSEAIKENLTKISKVNNLSILTTSLYDDK